MLPKCRILISKLCPISNTINRLCHSTIQQNQNPNEIKHQKAAQDVINYLESTEEYKDIVSEIPNNLLKKYKTPESMYLINKKTAKSITDTLLGYINKNAPLVEVNPGFGILTQKLLQCQNNPIALYEISHNFTKFLTDIQNQYPKRISYKMADFFGMWKLAFQDKIDQGNRINELLGDLSTSDSDRIITIIGAMPSLSFVRHLINNIVFHNDTNNLGRPDLYIVMPRNHYEFLIDSGIQMGKHKSVPALFQLLFDYKLLDKVPKAHFLPWIYAPTAKKISMMDEHCLYLVRMTQKKTLPCTPEYLPLLWYFFKPHTFSKTTRVIPMLEQWIPGCGVWLITGQDPPDTNKQLSPDELDAKLPHMTIFTAFGDLSLQQKITVFKRFISWPEFEQCPFRATMENNLPKFASALNDEDDKSSIGAHIDEIESSDIETEPHNI